ncbi:MAG: PHP domain-containing protein [Pseudomonadota bacterium]
MDLIDLHAHTTASDGTLPPGELVELAFRLGLKALAVTDHDTLAGLPEALERGRRTGVEVVAGVEISAEFKPGAMHILGYDLDLHHQGLTMALERLQESRRTRNPKIAAKLKALGLDITLAEVEAEAGGGQVGRPHFASVLHRKGYVSSLDEAFRRYLTKGAPAYEEKFRFWPDEAVGMIVEAGGIPVLAHPFTLKLDEPGALEELLIKLMKAGLIGLEVHYPKHDPGTILDYLFLARKLGLAPTGGSDYHGKNNDGVELGSGYGDLAVPYELLAGLRRAFATPKRLRPRRSGGPSDGDNST